jgi:hypothetical protein
MRRASTAKTRACVAAMANYNNIKHEILTKLKQKAKPPNSMDKIHIETTVWLQGFVAQTSTHLFGRVILVFATQPRDHRHAARFARSRCLLTELCCALAIVRPTALVLLVVILVRVDLDFGTSLTMTMKR